jgi:LysM repeat protein
MSVALLPTAAFAQYGNQGRAYNPGPRPQSSHSQSKNNNQKHNNKKNDNKKHDNKKDDSKKNDNKKHHDSCATVYKVQKGDTLSEIAHHFHVSQHKLAKANGIKNPNHIFVGQRLCIP